jgi:glutathione S-transferase
MMQTLLVMRINVNGQCVAIEENCVTVHGPLPPVRTACRDWMQAAIVQPAFHPNQGVPMAALTLVFGNKNYSSWSLRPWLLMQHMGVAFTERRIALDMADTPALVKQYSPTKKVPVLVDGALTVWDSLAICEYVSEQYLDGRGWPADVMARARARAMSAEMHSGFMELRSQWPMNVREQRKLPLNAGLQKDIARLEASWGDALQRSGGPFLFGEFCIADAMYAPVVLRFNSYQPDVLPLTETYMQTILALPALQSWMAAGRAETEVIKEDEVGYLLGEPDWESKVARPVG